MKLLIIAACLVASPVLAQSASTPAVSPDLTQAALGAEVMECVSAKVQFRARINQLEADLAKLKPAAAEAPK